MFASEVTRPKDSITMESEFIENPMASGMRLLSFSRPKRRASESSVSSTDSWLSRGSTIPSSSLSDCFSVLGLPLELELSIMGTVDQSILERARVAQDKRSRGCSSRSLPSSRQNSRTRLLNFCTVEDDETRVDDKGFLSTTLCSTEL
ncbi:Hypothetical predicted protein [Paramuricea clavata]|uniref:Uncharacterized protein n=1 Tax=Paramuricea clavata TaxID=317549 RepID=A0A7D9L6R9_PARCT|nr:Hypothetical predicted protein [Paramuricea clavata]